MEKLRWGVLGAGGIADRRTLPGMVLARNAELIAVMEIDAENAERLRAKYGAKRAYTSDQELLKDPEVDAVYIASPVVLHARQAKLAADNGKHILLEKPLAMTADEAEEIVNYCEARGIMIAAGFMMRFGAYVQEMKKAVQAGKIGQVVSCDALFSCWYPDMPGAWRQYRENSGGGSLMDMGVHCIDLIQYITGSRVKQVAAMHDTMTFQYEVEDSSTVLMRLENGAICTVQSNFNIPDEAAKWQLNFFGTKGRLLGDNVIGQVDGGSVDAMFMEENSGYNARQDGKTVKKAQIDAELGNTYTREIESFGDSVLKGLPLEVPASDAVCVQRIVEAAYKSNDQKRVVEL